MMSMSIFHCAIAWLLLLLATTTTTSSCEGFTTSQTTSIPSTRPSPFPTTVLPKHKIAPSQNHHRSQKRKKQEQPSHVLFASSSSSSEAALSKKWTPPSPAISAGFLIGLDVLFRQLFAYCKIAFPSSLGGCMALFGTLLLLKQGKTSTDHNNPMLFEWLSPGAGLLAKWLPVFFVPSLITLPLANSVGPPSEILKILAVIVGGFFFTLGTTAGSVVGIRKRLGGGETKTKETPVVAAKITPITPKPFSSELLYQLRICMAATAGFCIVGARQSMNMAAVAPMSALFLLSTTLHNFVWGARLKPSFTKWVHPLVTCTTLTWLMGTVFGKFIGSSFSGILHMYKTGRLMPLTATGAGDVLLFLLGPAVVSLAISMYDRRQLMQSNWKEVATGVGVSSVGGLFGTAWAVRLLQVGSPSLRLSLLSRNITSPLAMAIAAILGADVSIAVSMVVVTGLIGANFGASILDFFGILDPVARGLGIGAAAHGLGTAAFVKEENAFPFAAISMALTATACTCLVSVPLIRRAVLQIALGGV